MQLRLSRMAAFVSSGVLLAWVAACSSSASDSAEAMYGTPAGNYGGGASGASNAGGAAGAARADASTAMDSAIDEKDAAAEAALQDADTCAQLDSSKSLVLYQSADDSNSMGSPVIARRIIHAGEVVPGAILRTYEFLNYYNILYEPPQKGHVTVVPQMRPGKLEGEYILQVGLQGENATTPRRPLNITFVLDNTGSMDGTPLALEKAAVKAIAASMKAGDLVSMLAWNTDQWVLLDNL
jgi:Ca-activated chloride channel homolog